MKKNQGFIGILIAVLVALALGGGATYVAVKSGAFGGTAKTDVNANTEVTAQGNEQQNGDDQGSQVVSGNTAVSSDGNSASIDVGGVHLGTNGTSASINYGTSANGGSINTAPGSATVKTTVTGSAQTSSGSASAGTNASVSGSVSSSVTLSSISPTSASIGDTITIHGTGFSANNNTVNVYFGAKGQIAGVASTNGGTTISLTIPSYITTGPISIPVERGTYIVSVTNASGATSGGVTFTLK